MKTYLVELPDGITPTDCTVCGDRYPCGLKHCALDKAKEAFEKTSVEMCACVVAKDRGNPVKLFAVEDK